MPRLPPALIRQAKSENPFLYPLLRVCRDLHSARNELRWLREHVQDVVSGKRRIDSLSVGAGAYVSDRAVGNADKSTICRTTSQLAHKRDGLWSSRPHRAVTGSGMTSSDLAARQASSRSPKRSVYTRARRYSTSHSTKFPDLPRGMVNSQSQSPATPPGDHQMAESNHQEHSTYEAGMEHGRPEPVKTIPVSKHFAARKSPKIRTFTSEGSQRITVNIDARASRPSPDVTGKPHVQQLLGKAVGLRAKGVPLQYIMGNQPFGTLDILCRPRVFIPRAATEMYTEKVARLLLGALTATGSTVESTIKQRKKIRILDLCTGTGCIALLLHSILKPAAEASPLPQGLEIEVLGIDQSPDAVNLARENLKHNVERGHLHTAALSDVSFQEMDVLALGRLAYRYGDVRPTVRQHLNAVGERPVNNALDESWDLVVSNPPYIDPKDLALGGKTEPSVRDYEPKDALVPRENGQDRRSLHAQADLFYRPLALIARAVGAQLLVLEIGDSGQAFRAGKKVVSVFRSPVATSATGNIQLEIWKDDDSVRTAPSESVIALTQNFPDPDTRISDRAVVVWNGQLAKWRHQSSPISDHGPDKHDVIGRVDLTTTTKPASIPHTVPDTDISSNLAVAGQEPKQTPSGSTSSTRRRGPLFRFVNDVKSTERAELPALRIRKHEVDNTGLPVLGDTFRQALHKTLQDDASGSKVE